MAKEHQITSWISPLETIKTVNGDLSATQWLESEMNRINQNPKRKAVIREGDKGLCIVETNGVKYSKDHLLVIGED